MEVFILKLEGQGDIEHKVVDRETYEWITGPSGRPPGNPSSWPDPFWPESQRKATEEILSGIGINEPAALTLTSGSWENDRALGAISHQNYCALDLWQEDPTQEIRARAEELGDNIIGFWEGCIY